MSSEITFLRLIYQKHTFNHSLNFFIIYAFIHPWHLEMKKNQFTEIQTLKQNHFFKSQSRTYKFSGIRHYFIKAYVQ